jgi:hypothetical protein
MLAEARSERFVRHFSVEWLKLREIGFTAPDPNLHPE